jgi:hypothetical protein
MRVIIHRKPVRSIYDWDDLDGLAQISGARAAAEEYQRRKAEQLKKATSARHRRHGNRSFERQLRTASASSA